MIPALSFYFFVFATSLIGLSQIIPFALLKVWTDGPNTGIVRPQVNKLLLSRVSELYIYKEVGIFLSSI